MTPDKEKELRKHLKTLDKDQLIELLVQYKCDAELLQGVANDTLDAMNEKLVLEKALELLIENIELESCYYCPCRELEFNNCNKIDGSEKCFAFIREYFKKLARERLDEKRD